MCKSVIKLPVKDDATPDWGWMEEYIKSLPMAEHLPRENQRIVRGTENNQYVFVEKESLKVAEKIIKPY